MGHGLYNNTYAPWVMGCTKTYPPHGSWAVHWCINLMGPWSMGCTTVYIPHGSWAVQWYIYPMGHVLYNSIYTPCTMGCTTTATVYIPHAPWVVQQLL